MVSNANTRSKISTASSRLIGRCAPLESCDETSVQAVSSLVSGTSWPGSTPMTRHGALKISNSLSISFESRAGTRPLSAASSEPAISVCRSSSGVSSTA